MMLEEKVEATPKGKLGKRKRQKKCFLAPTDGQHKLLDTAQIIKGCLCFFLVMSADQILRDSRDRILRVAVYSFNSQGGFYTTV